MIDDCHPSAPPWGVRGTLFSIVFRNGHRYITGMEKDARKLKERDDLMENAGKLLVDLGKLIFGSMFLGGILRGELPQVIIDLFRNQKER
ncbi:MAG: hypothetical protein FWB79_04635 [Treponema sp.]|nr:hypothetical protein [Treponema sp.]